MLTRDRYPQRPQKMQILRGEGALFLRVPVFLRLRASGAPSGCSSTSFSPIVASSISITSKPCRRISATTPAMLRRLRHALVNRLAQLLNQFTEFLIQVRTSFSRRQPLIPPPYADSLTLSSDVPAGQSESCLRFFCAARLFPCSRIASAELWALARASPPRNCATGPPERRRPCSDPGPRNPLPPQPPLTNRRSPLHLPPRLSPKAAAVSPAAQDASAHPCGAPSPTPPASSPSRSPAPSSPFSRWFLRSTPGSSTNPPGWRDHHLPLYAAFAVLFAWFTVSSFWRASRSRSAR